MATLGLRYMYGKKELHNIGDIKGLKVRVQATPTEDAIFPAYGAQTVHMPFGSVYTSLQTGVVDFAENGINVYQANKHYEVAPVLSMTMHEANNSVIWVSDKVWTSLSDDQKKWVQAAADEVSTRQPALALGLEHESQAKLMKLGVKFVTDPDLTGFIKPSPPPSRTARPRRWAPTRSRSWRWSAPTNGPSRSKPPEARHPAPSRSCSPAAATSNGRRWTGSSGC